MSSCVHLIQQAHEKLPLDFFETLRDEDEIIVMNRSEKSFKRLQSSIPRTCKIHILASNDQEQSNNEFIDYKEFVNIISQHKKSISW